jgi:purine-binding chemotaxis protein CheW
MNPSDPRAPLPRFGLARDVLRAGDQAQGFAPAPAEEGPQARTQIVAFFLGREKYGLEIKRVREVNRIVDITLVPNSPSYVKGVINLRGRIVPVIELGFKLGLGRTEPGKANRVVVVEYQGELLGLLVDRMDRVVHIPTSRIETPPGDAEEGKIAGVMGIVETEDEVIMLMDLDKALQRDRAADQSGADHE